MGERLKEPLLTIYRKQAQGLVINPGLDTEVIIKIAKIRSNKVVLVIQAKEETKILRAELINRPPKPKRECKPRITNRPVEPLEVAGL